MRKETRGISFIYAEKAQPHKRSREGRLFTSDLAPNGVWPVNDVGRTMLEKWCQRFPCHHEGVHGTTIAATNGGLSRDLAEEIER